MEERELIRQCKNGQMSCYNELIKLHEENLYKYCYHITMNEQAGQDLFQETWIKVMGKIHQYKEAYSFKSWLITIARNTYLDQYRKMKRRGRYEMDFKDDAYKRFIMESVSSEQETETLITNKETSDHLIRALNKLKVKFREVLVLYYFQELTMKEISLIVKVPEGTIKSRLHKAKKLLEKELEVVDL